MDAGRLSALPNHPPTSEYDEPDDQPRTPQTKLSTGKKLSVADTRHPRQH
jgi:hypothetical protein